MADRARRKRRRLSRSGEFERVYREGRSYASRHLVVYCFPRADRDGAPRLGLSVGRKLGGAVERNRMKRLLREAFWARADDLDDGYDFVIVARPAVGELAREGGDRAVADALADVLAEAGLTADESRGGSKS
jgi:ribonuclease P protein component